MSVTLPEVILHGTFATRPAAGSAGRLYFASDTLKQYRDNGTSWDEVTPTGGGGGGGSVIASLYVDAAETTTSTSYVDLTTPDSVTFTLSGTTTVVIQYMATVLNTVATAVLFNIPNIDGTDATVQPSAVCQTTANGAVASVCGYRVSLGTGSHTIKIRHKVNTGTGTWQARLLVVMAG